MIEEHNSIKKDSKPYIIFKCSKCKQYMYVKPTQKTKKCLRCGRTHTIQKIKRFNEIEIVEGMSAAVQRVKELQNQYAIEKLQGVLNLKGEDSFSIVVHKKKVYLNEFETICMNKSLEKRFIDLLQDLSKKYSQFPRYMIELVAEEYNIEKKEIELLIRQFLDQKKLISLNNNYFTIN